MIASMCAYTCEHDYAYVCMYAWESLLLCMHTRVGMVAPMCAYSTPACDNENTKSKQDKNKCDELERYDCVYACVCASIYT